MKAAIGSEGWRMGSEQAGHLAGHHGTCGDGAQAGQGKLQQRGRCQAAQSGPLAFDPGAKQPDDATQAGTYIEHRRSDFHWPRLRTASDAHEAALGLQNKVEPAPARIRTDVTVAGDGPVNE